MKKFVSFLLIICCLDIYSSPIKSALGAKGAIDSENPSAYREVQFITKTSGKVQFPTGIYNSSPWELTTIGWFPKNSTYYHVFGAWYSTSGWTGYGFTWNNTLSSRPVHGDKYGNYWSASSANFKYDEPHCITCLVTEKSCRITWDGITRTASSSVGLNGEQIYLLGNGYTNTAGIGHGLGETTIMQDGVLVAHLIPCIRLSDNEPIFYDIVRNIEIENSEDGIAGVIEKE